MRFLCLSLAVLSCTGCATARPPPPECRLIETTARPCQPVPWLDGPAFERQRREQMKQDLRAWSIDAGQLLGPLPPVDVTDGGPVD